MSIKAELQSKRIEAQITQMEEIKGTELIEISKFKLSSTVRKYCMFIYPTPHCTRFNSFDGHLYEQVNQIFQTVKTRVRTANRDDLGRKVATFFIPMLRPFAALVTLGCILGGVEIGVIQGANPPRVATFSRLESAAMIDVLHPG